LDLPRLKLKKHEERRLKAGHAWVFANEVDTGATPLAGFEPGALAAVETARGDPLGVAYVNPRTLIVARLLTRRADVAIDADFVGRRIRRALALRERLYPTPHYRLFFAESDGLPGLIVDRYGEHLVAHVTTAGMLALWPLVLEALVAAVKPAGVLLRTDGGHAELEGIEPRVEAAHGDVPGDVRVREGELEFAVDPRGGQKTGWFYDQRDNRLALPRYLGRGRMLDVCGYVGAFALQAAHAGAEEAMLLDRSADALERAGANAERNGLSLLTAEAEAMDGMKQLHGDGEKFATVVLDPPALIARKRDLQPGTLAYRRLILAAANLVAPGGTLLACSCSQRFTREALVDGVRRAALKSGRSAQVLSVAGAGPDHPVHPAMPETEYLKVAWVRFS